jgi:hypothetical protein
MAPASSASFDLRPERSRLQTAAMSRLLSIHHDDCRHARPPRISKSPWPGRRPPSHEPLIRLALPTGLEPVFLP